MSHNLQSLIISILILFVAFEIRILIGLVIIESSLFDFKDKDYINSVLRIKAIYKIKVHFRYKNSYEIVVNVSGSEYVLDRSKLLGSENREIVDVVSFTKLVEGKLKVVMELDNN